MGLEVVRISASASFQDSGRYGYRNFGVPNSGAFDHDAMLLANALLGNNASATILELCAVGGIFRACEPISVAIAGAEPRCQINGASGPVCGVINMLAGEELDIFSFTRGNCLAMAVPGGFQCSRTLGSCSERFTGNTLYATENRFVGSRTVSDAVHSWPIHELPIVLATGYTELTWEAPFTVSAQSSRIGVRLLGAPSHTNSLPSRPTCPGVVQWTPGGEIIIVGPDGPTLGGYPQIGFIPLSALPKVAQLVAGQQIRIRPIDESEIGAINARTQRILQMIRITHTL